MNKERPFIPTGFTVFDIILGQNVRDREGNLLDVQRGFQISKQYLFAGERGTGKTTLIQSLTSFGKHIEYPLNKIYVFNTDNADYSDQRLQKITKIPKEELDSVFKVYDMDVAQDIVKMLDADHKAYKAEKFKEVKYEDIYTGEIKKMYPYNVVILDTVTAIRTEDNDVDSKGNVIGKQLSWVEFNAVSKLVNVIYNYFERNCIIVWATHLKDNKSDNPMVQPAKEYKSAPGNKKANVPNKMRDRMDFVGNMYAQDSQNRDSSKHPIQIYQLTDLKNDQIYATTLVPVKSRFGCEGRTKCTFLFINGEFDRTLSNFATFVDLGLFRECGGNYPTKDDVAAFDHLKDTRYWKDYAASRSAKRAVTVEGYPYKTNLIEARMLMTYSGSDPQVLERASLLIQALYQQVEDRLYYELETNNVSNEELDTNQKQLANMLSNLKKIQRPSKINLEKLRTMDQPDEIDLDALESQSENDDFAA